jgi:hypothetical protein
MFLSFLLRYRHPSHSCCYLSDLHRNTCISNSALSGPNPIAAPSLSSHQNITGFPLSSQSLAVVSSFGLRLGAFPATIHSPTTLTFFRNSPSPTEMPISAIGPNGSLTPRMDRTLRTASHPHLLHSPQLQPSSVPRSSSMASK